MSRELTDTDKTWLRSLAKELHVNPSKETCRRLDKLEYAFFGDPDDDSDKGMQAMIKDIHGIFTGAKFATRSVIYIFGGLGIVIGGVYACIRLLKDVIFSSV